MTRTRILLNKAPAEGGAPSAASGAGISLEDINLSDAAFEKLGLPADLRSTPLANGPGKQPETEKQKPDEQDETATAEAELAARAKAAGKTVEEQTAAEEAEATAETERLTAKAAELGKTVDEVKTLEAEEAAASAPPELNAEQTEYVQALVSQHEETLNAANAAKAEAEQKAAALETQLAQAQRPPVQLLGIHPILLADNEEAIGQQDTAFAQFEQWALKHWDGSEATEAKGDQPAQPAYTADQIRARYAEVKELRAKLVPAARERLNQRTALEGTAKTIYPALFDSKRPESQATTAMLQNYPELRAIFPNFHVIAGDAFVGERVRNILADPKNKANAAASALLNAVPELKTLLAIKAPSGAATAKPKAVLPPKPLARPAVSAPGKVPRPGGGAAARTATSKTATGPSAARMGELQRGGLSEREALTSMINGLDLPTLAPTNANAD
jgi:hypothetical protein